MELEESGAEVGGFQRTLKDLFAGAAGGIAQVLLGQLVPIVCYHVYKVIRSI